MIERNATCQQGGQTPLSTTSRDASMTSALDIHLAGDEERTAAFRNFHDSWGGGLGVEEHVQARQSSVKHKRAQWYVGCLDGRVVTACGCYSKAICIDGRIEPACALGEVHTLAEFRGRGFAPQLIAFVETDQRAAGRTISLLYSDIAPSYYERLGYLLCACPQGWTDPQSTGEAAGALRVRLQQFDPVSRLSTMAELYERSHAALSFWIVRSPSDWQELLSRFPDDEYYFAESAAGERLGYIRVSVRGAGDELNIWDFALIEQNESTERALLTALLRLAQSRGIKRVGGWMPAGPAHRALFQISERTRELTMVKPLVSRIQIGKEHREAGAFLHACDHV
jgi:GNAT superfamily N-acetyltransferase